MQVEERKTFSTPDWYGVWLFNQGYLEDLWTGCMTASLFWGQVDINKERRINEDAL